jgi:GAF domain-containing protein
MPAAPIPAGDAVRVAMLRRHPVAGPGPDPTLDTVVRVAAMVFETPIALITLVDGRHQHFKAAFGLDRRETPRAWSMCGYTILSDLPLVIEDASADPRTADNPLVTGALGVRFYAGVRLLVDTEAVGALCVVDRVPRRFRATDVRLLARMADIAAARIARM